MDGWMGGWMRLKIINLAEGRLRPTTAEMKKF